MTTSIEKNNPKLIKSWAMYDWANSAYNLVITTTIFPAYYTSITQSMAGVADGVDGNIEFLGITLKSSSLINYVLAFSYLIIAFLSPILSSIADTKGNKKSWMKFFTYMGASSCCLLYFFTDATLVVSMFLFGLAAIGFTGSIVFYNSYLPEISTFDKQDTVSAKGYAYGYIGSVILQVLCLLLIMYSNVFGIDKAQASRVSFLLTGLWWMGFSQIPFRDLPQGTAVVASRTQSLLADLSKVFQAIKNYPALKVFLTSYFFYIGAVNTIMLVSAIFASKEIKGMTSIDLISVILVIQIVAVIGARVMAVMSFKMGNVKVLIVNLIIWLLVCFIGYKVETKVGFYGLAVMVGFVMGGVQSLSRATYSKLLPSDIRETACYFSFFDVVEKFAIVIGMLLFATVGQLYSMRYSALALSIPFSMGLLVLIYMWVRLPKYRLASQIQQS